MKKIFELIAHVAFSDTTVLLSGETGTGKELVANAIHQSSPRKNNQMVKVNCAAMPASLVESELFGHEKGSFTGATEKRIGKFELANKGTLLLDEIGELPLELQVKLLRAIQEKEFERVGGTQTIKTDVRIIAATMLAARFMNRVSKKCGKNVVNISPHALKQLMAYDWPGNIRELEHLVERTVLLTSGATIKEFDLPAMVLKSHLTGAGANTIQSLHEMEKEYILSVLKKTAGKIHGAGGAAQLLKLPATTLASKMKKLGIRKKHE